MLPIRYELPDPAYEEHTWLLQDEHMPASQPPLLLPPEAAARAGGTGPPPSLIINGYTYTRLSTQQSPLFPNASPPETVEELRRWRQEWLPQVEDFARRLEGFEPAAVAQGTWTRTLQEHDREAHRLFMGVHGSGVTLAHLAMRRFSDAFVLRFGEERRQDALALIHGFPNKSTERAAALWELSRLVRANRPLQEALDGTGRVPASGAGVSQFREGLAGMLEMFGHTTNSNMEDMPTWREDVTIPLAIIRAYSRQDDSGSPGARQRRQGDRRRGLEAELRQRTTEEPSLAELLRLLEMAQEFLPNLEDHNLLADQRVASASRGRWLAIGRRLQRLDAASSPDDVFYYSRAELIGTLEGGASLSSDEIAGRRDLQVAYRSAPPPAVLGRPLEDPPPSQPLLPREGAMRLLRGTPASPGSWRGRARIIESVAQAASLREGDVLVCRSATPPWTPYFEVAGALVVSSGGILSHAAVIARELGVPAVTGALNATALIPEGSMVVVDGTGGTVIVEGG